jgi:hypothetical protein
MKHYKVSVGARGLVLDKSKLVSYRPWFSQQEMLFDENELTREFSVNTVSEYSFTRGMMEYIVPRFYVSLI